MEKTIEKRLNRSEVPVEMTWNLGDLFSSREEWQKELVILEENLKDVVAFKGHVCDDAKTLLACLTTYENFYTKMIHFGSYTSLRQSEDGTNPINQEDSLIYSGFSTKVDTALSFISAELLELTESDVVAFVEEEKELTPFKQYLIEIIESKKHKLSPETEEVLAALGEVSYAPYRIYSVSKAADMQFESFQNEKNEELPNSFAMYESKYEFSPNATVRANAYESFTKTLQSYKNTYAATYATEVRRQVASSKFRNYESVTHMLLDSQKVTVEMYENQLNVIFNELAPHMRRFAKLKKEQLGLETMRFCDLKAPLDVEFNPPATYEDTKETIINALKVMGPEYTEIMEKAYANRWIDYSDNVGKSTGAFCSTPYGIHPYILISWQDNMRSAFTLAHELGHAGHFYLANKYQTLINTRPSTYFVEAPSTLNEMLLAQYLMKQTEDPRMKRWVILQLLGTYYHNFVTHLLEAEFQRRVYALAEKNVSLTAKTLCETKGAVLKEFWGDSVEIDEGATLTWMRQPHYYMGLYPYTYSAGLTASTAISQQIAEEGQPAIDRWLHVLKAGGTMKPEELMKTAGVDMTNPEPIKKAVSYVGSLITELEDLYQ